MAGEISYINLNGDVRPIGSIQAQADIENTLKAQNNTISDLTNQLENTRNQLIEMANGYASLVESLKSGSIIQQTPDGFFVGVKKSNFVINITQIGDKTIHIKLYRDGEEIVDMPNTFRVRVSGIKNGESRRLNSDVGNFLLRDGTLDFTYTITVDSVTVVVYDSEGVLASNTLNLTSKPQGLYTVEIICGDGGTILNNDEPLNIRCYVCRNGENVHDIVSEYIIGSGNNLLYTLSWNNNQGGMSNLTSNDGLFNISKELIPDSVEFNCEIDIPVDTLEQEVFS